MFNYIRSKLWKLSVGYIYPDEKSARSDLEGSEASYQKQTKCVKCLKCNECGMVFCIVVLLN